MIRFLPILSLVAILIVLGACQQKVEQPTVTPPAEAKAEIIESDGDFPRIPVGADKRVLQLISDNLDQDAAEEQVLLLQSRTNLSLPIEIQVADYDTSRKTYYLAWEGKVLASASQPFTFSLVDLLGDHQKELTLKGVDEQGRTTLDVFRLSAPTAGIGLNYASVFSRTSQGTISIVEAERPESYNQGQNSTQSDRIEIEDPLPSHQQNVVLTSYEWSFQKGEYTAGDTKTILRPEPGAGPLESLYAGDNSGIQTFLKGPWVRTVSEKTGVLLLFFDPVAKEITFATNAAQESYTWDVNNRSSRSSLYIVGSNTLINLIKLQMSVTISSMDSIEISVPDNPAWTGNYRKLDPASARSLTHEEARALPQVAPPSGVYRDDKGDEFDFQSPQVRVTLGGTVLVGAMATYDLNGLSILQLEASGGAAGAQLSKVYLMTAKEESSTARIVRTLRLQEGNVTTAGWVSNQTDPIRLEQVDATASH